MQQNELSLSNDLIPLDRYLSQLSKSTSSRYLLSLLARPLQWSYTQLRSSITGEADSPGSAEEEAIWKSRKGDYVLVGLVSVRFVPSTVLAPSLTFSHFAG